MRTEAQRRKLQANYERSAQAYLASLPLEHFTEATTQSRQREITVGSFALIKPQRPDFHYFSELLVQYPRPGRRRGQVVPDNMVVLHKGEIDAEGSFDLPLQPAGPFWTLEYVSRSSERKDYEDNMLKYEHELKVPYYLLFQPDVLEVCLFRHTGKKYVSVKPNARGRYAVEELRLEVALADNWVRYWLRGELLPLPAELLLQREEAVQRADEADRLRTEAVQRATAAESELERLRAELEQLRARPRRNGNGR